MLSYQIQKPDFEWLHLLLILLINLNGIKTFLANDLSTFFIKNKPVFSNGSRRLPRSPPWTVEFSVILY